MLCPGLLCVCVGGILVGMGPSTTPASTTGSWRGVNTRAGIFDGLIHREDEAGGLRGSGQSVDTYDGWLPHTCLEIICDVLVVHVHTVPRSTLIDPQIMNTLIHRKTFFKRFIQSSCTEPKIILPGRMLKLPAAAVTM